MDQFNTEPFSIDVEVQSTNFEETSLKNSCRISAYGYDHPPAQKKKRTLELWWQINHRWCKMRKPLFQNAGCKRGKNEKHLVQEKLTLSSEVFFYLMNYPLNLFSQLFLSFFLKQS